MVNASAARHHLNPALVAWIGSIRVPPRALAKTVARFEDSDDFLLAPNAFDFNFFVIHLAQQGVRGIDLIRLIRRRSAAGILALGDVRGDEFVPALDSGADMVISQNAPVDHLEAAMRAVRRRIGQGQASMEDLWKLHEERAVLQAPDGTQIALSDSDLAIMRCFADAKGARVGRDVLIEQLWGTPKDAMDNALHATLYRLRKRIEHAGQALVPVHAVSKVGYEFRAPLERG